MLLGNKQIKSKCGPGYIFVVLKLSQYPNVRSHVQKKFMQTCHGVLAHVAYYLLKALKSLNIYVYMYM